MIPTRLLTLGAGSLMVVAAAAAAAPALGVTVATARSTATVANAASAGRVHVVTTRLGAILVDTRGHAMYRFAKDSPNVSRCAGQCLTYWPPVPAGTTPGTHPPGVSAVFGVIVRPGGFRQLTINHWPVYRYLGDAAPGQINGQGIPASGARWWLVSPAGRAVLRTH